jgi:hypothetical protein
MQSHRSYDYSRPAFLLAESICLRSRRWSLMRGWTTTGSRSRPWWGRRGRCGCWSWCRSGRRSCRWCRCGSGRRSCRRCWRGRWSCCWCRCWRGSWSSTALQRIALSASSRSTRAVAEVLSKDGVVSLHPCCCARVAVAHGPINYIEAALSLIQP